MEKVPNKLRKFEAPEWLTAEAWAPIRQALEDAQAAFIGGSFNHTEGHLFVKATWKSPHPDDVLVNDDRYLATWSEKVRTEAEMKALPQKFIKWRDAMIAHGPMPA